MIAIPGSRDAIESTAPSSSASTVARGIQVWATHPPEALQGRRQQMQGRAAERGDPQRPADRVRATGSAAIPRHLFDIVEKSPRLEGVMVRNYYDLAAESEEFQVRSCGAAP
ncbi:hypothetical protein [Streptomyces sp. NPDC058011]|uniref:hypothetical protein n=1 Tax=Streptomyces sp. NPDC058011 TaxID=3346305 RepID=UPI0036E29FB6